MYPYPLSHGGLLSNCPQQLSRPPARAAEHTVDTGSTVSGIATKDHDPVQINKCGSDLP